MAARSRARGIATSPPHQFEQMVPTPPIIPLLAPIALVRMWERHEREWPPPEFHHSALLAEGCAKSIGQNAALENKPFIIGTLIDMKVTHQPCRCTTATAFVHASDNSENIA